MSKTMTDTITTASLQYPKYVGFYQFGDLRLSFQKRPSRWHQFWMRVCLDFHWHDGPDEYIVHGVVR